MASQKDEVTSAKALLELGAGVVRSLKETSPDALDRLDEYTTAFDRWQRSWPTAGQKFSARERQIGERIAEQHATVLELTEGMLHSVERSLRELRGWSKGIRAYLDHFPRQVSTIKTKKG